MGQSARRTASSTLVTPRAVNSPVSTAWAQEVGTKDWAARLYSSSGRACCTALIKESWSSRSPSSSSTRPRRWRMRWSVTTLERRIKPKTS